MIGAVSVIFDCNPFVSVESKSYCTIATIPKYDFKELLCFFPCIKQPIIDSIINNPYDMDRDYFVYKC